MLKSKHKFVIVLKMYLKGVLCGSVKYSHLRHLKP